MSLYIGTKIVRAEPMTRDEFERTVRKLGDTTDKELVHHGYSVTYPEGYRSWCPKDVFEANNRLVSPAEHKLLQRG